MDKLERAYRSHLRRMALGLAFSLAMGVAMIVALVRQGFQPAIVIAPALVFIVASIGLEIVLRGRVWPRRDAEDRQIGRDEWVQTNIHRSRRAALLAIYAAQVPLMFLVAYLPPDPTVSTSVIGMAILTMASGQFGFFGSYLLYSRQPADG